MTSPPAVHKLIGPDALPAELDRAALAAAYAWPISPVNVRANMIATLDGAVTGSDGLSGSVGDATDKVVFDLLRAASDAIVVGAGTARAENYGPPPPGRLLVVVSRSGQLPESLLAHPDAVVLAAPESSGSRLENARAVLGPDRVWVLGADGVPPSAVRARLEALGRHRILLEGGPVLLGEWLAAGCVDELCLTTVPRLLGGGRGLLPSRVGDIRVEPEVLLECAGTVLGRWHVLRRD